MLLRSRHAACAGRLTRVNERYCQILERPKTALMNCHIFDYLDAAQLAENQHLLERALAQCVAFDIHSKYLKPDGVPTWVSHAVTPIRVHASAPVSCLMAVLQEAATPRM